MTVTNDAAKKALSEPASYEISAGGKQLVGRNPLNPQQGPLILEREKE